MPPLTLSLPFSNEILFFGYFIILASILLFALRLGKEYVLGMVAILVLMANIFVLKPYEIFGLTTYGGNAMFGVIFLATDLLAEYYGKKEAIKAVRVGFASLFLYFITATVYTSIQTAPLDDWSIQVGESIATIFSPALGIVIASLTAFTISNTFDIHFYEFIKSHTGERWLWIRNNLSTIFSQFIDTCTFSFIALYFGVFEADSIWQVIFLAYLFKLMVAILDTPFMYLSRVTQRWGREA